MTKKRVRFHLAQGPNFQNWQIKCGETVEYYDPQDVNLLLFNCKLRNQTATAKRIFNGANKTVCAWIECDHVKVITSATDKVPAALDFLYYNPRNKPYWHCSRGRNRDGYGYPKLVTQGQLVTIIN
jgi:hypothetical protein